MKVFVNYPVMVIPGVYRYENIELDMTVEQVPYAVENIEHELTMDYDKLYICVKSTKDAEKLAMTRKAQIDMKEDIYHMANIISLVTNAVDQIHRGHDSAIEKAAEHLELQELYGNVPEDIKRHVDNCLTSIHSNLER